jgi:hypothetical protein
MSSMMNLPPDDQPRAVSPPMPLPIDVFDPVRDSARHAGRSAVRRAAFAMTPTSGAEYLLPGPLGSIGAAEGAFWGLQGKNGLTLALRAASFGNPLAARSDAIEILARASSLEFVEVRRGLDGPLSYWVVLEGRVVLVAGQSWRRPEKSTERMLRSTLAGLPRA